MNDWLWIALGLAALIAAAEALVRGSVWCALALGVSPMMVGLTLVAFGTSAPELFVSISAVLRGKPDFATGSVLGSNIANIGLIVGLTAIVKPIDHVPRTARFEVRFLVLISALITIPAVVGARLGILHGVTLLTILAGFTLIAFHRENRRRKARRLAGDERPRVATGAWAVVGNLALVLGGLVGLKLGGDLLVDGASGVASSIGLSEASIGATVIAMGTSLPELAASVVAARRGHPGLALGNVLGSNIFNICMVLGVASVVGPLPMSRADAGVAALVGLALAAVLAWLLRYRAGVSRIWGGLLLVAYLGYLTAAVLGGSSA